MFFLRGTLKKELNNFFKKGTNSEYTFFRDISMSISTRNLFYSHRSVHFSCSQIILTKQLIPSLNAVPPLQ